MIRFDLIFSYWILLWFILYVFKVIPYNPLFWLWIAFIENFINIGLMIYYKRYLFLLAFSVVIFIIKVLPIMYLSNTYIKLTINDIAFGFMLFLVYYIWLIYNKMSLYKLYNSTYNSIKNNNPSYTTPFLYFMNKIEINIIR